MGPHANRRGTWTESVPHANHNRSRHSSDTYCCLACLRNMDLHWCCCISVVHEQDYKDSFDWVRGSMFCGCTFQIGAFESENNLFLGQVVETAAWAIWWAAKLSEFPFSSEFGYDGVAWAVGRFALCEILTSVAPARPITIINRRESRI